VGMGATKLPAGAGRGGGGGTKKNREGKEGNKKAKHPGVGPTLRTVAKKGTIGGEKRVHPKKNEKGGNKGRFQKHPLTKRGRKNNSPKNLRGGGPKHPGYGGGA